MQAPWMDALPMNTNVWVSGDKNLEQEVLAADTRPQELITDCEATPRPRSIQRGDGTAWREWRWRRRDRGYHDQVDARAVGKAAAGIRTSEAALEASSGGSSTAAVDRAWVRRQQSMQWRWLLKLQVGQETDQLRPAEVRRAPSTGRD